MKLIFFFLATSELFTAAAIPMMASEGPSAFGAPEPRPNQVPKFVFGSRMTTKDKAAAKDLMTDHYKGLQPGSDQKQAKLASTQNVWVDGMGHDDQHRQYLNFNYHRGDTLDSAIIGQTVSIARDRPPPEPRFSIKVLSGSKPDLTKEMNKKYSALPPDMARRVKSMKAQSDWADGSGLREEAQITFHDKPFPLDHTIIGGPVTIYRPMSFHMDGDVPIKEIECIKRRIREEHDKLDANHPLKQANFAVVPEGWKKVPKSPGPSWHVTPTMFKVKDRLSYSEEEDFEKIGDFLVPLGEGRRPKAQGISRAARKRLKAQASASSGTQP